MERKKNIKEVFIKSPINRNLDYGPSANQIEQINCHVPHIAGYYGQGVRVLYLDSGYELGHEAYDSLNLIAQYDFKLKDFCWDRLKSGQVIPGYGHAVLRCPDPRFTAFINFGREHIKEDDE